MIGDYFIFKNQVLGVGSFGQVLKGKSKVGNIPVAIKKLSIIKIDSSDFMHEALKQEVLIMKQCKSPNIVELYDFYITQNNYYLIQQFCDEDLSTLLKKKKQKNIQISQSQAIKMLTQICNGFLILIEHGIIHRDLKPANILVKDNVLKIGDFGISKKVPNMKYLNQTGIGTPTYMSLQQLKCCKYTSKCDIWALGTIFYEILHGASCTPFSAKSQYQIVQNILNKPLNIQRKDLDPNTIDFLYKCLQIEEKDRISWDQVFMHPIFKEHFIKLKKLDKSVKSSKNILKFQNRSNLMANLLKQKIQKDQIKVGDMLKTRKKSMLEPQLSFQQFYIFLKQIQPSIQQKDALEIFSSISQNKSKTVSKAQIQEWLRIQKGSIMMQKQMKSDNLIQQKEQKHKFVQRKCSLIQKQQSNSSGMLKSKHMRSKISRNPSLNIQQIIKDQQVNLKFTQQTLIQQYPQKPNLKAKNSLPQNLNQNQKQNNNVQAQRKYKLENQPKLNKILQNPLFNQIHKFL